MELDTDLIVAMMQRDTARKELATLRAQRDELRAVLERIATGRPDRLHCTQDALWEVMREIARAAIERARP